MTFEFALAQLRHLYAQMVNGHVTQPKYAAEGILGPAIEGLERVHKDSQRICQGEFTDEEVMKFVMALVPAGPRSGTDGSRYQNFISKCEKSLSKMLGFKKPANEQERQLLLAYYAAAGHMEPCCDCGEEYPRGDLVVDGYIECPKCRVREDNK